MANYETGLFNALEKALQAASTPLDCRQLFEFPAIKAHASNANRVSDYLGNLWRKGLIDRLPPEKSEFGQSRWRYQWRVSGMSRPESIEYTPRVLADRPSMLVTENGNVMTVEMPSLIISIRHKPARYERSDSVTNF